MNFKSHLACIRTGVLDVLLKDKEHLIEGVSEIAEKLDSLLRTDVAQSWGQWIEGIHWSQIPITKYAVKQEMEHWQRQQLQGKSMEHAMERTLKSLFTYWEEDDLCEHQGQFFYYKEATEDKLICESELGSIRTLGFSGPITKLRPVTLADLVHEGVIHAKNRCHLL